MSEINQLKDILQDIKIEMLTLKEDIEEVLETISSNNLLSSEIKEKIMSNILSLSRKQKAYYEIYSNIFKGKTMPVNISKLETEINLEERIVFYEYRKKFNEIHSTDKSIENSLEEYKEGLNILDIETLSVEECNQKFYKYIKFINAVDENDPVCFLQVLFGKSCRTFSHCCIGKFPIVADA